MIQVYISTHKIQEHFNGLGTKTTTSPEIQSTRAQQAKYALKNLFLCGFLFDKKVTKTYVKKESLHTQIVSPLSHSFVIGVIVCHILKSSF